MEAFKRQLHVVGRDRHVRGDLHELFVHLFIVPHSLTSEVVCDFAVLLGILTVGDAEDV